MLISNDLFGNCPLIFLFCYSGASALSISGLNLNGISAVFFFAVGANPITAIPKGSCINVQVVSSTLVTCTSPTLITGAYQVALQNGATQEWSVVQPVDGQASTAVALFLSQPIVTSLSNNVGSLYGGNPLTIQTNASGFSLVDPATSNQVVIGGLIPCDVISSSVTSTSITCIPQAVSLTLYPLSL